MEAILLRLGGEGSQVQILSSLLILGHILGRFLTTYKI